MCFMKGKELTVTEGNAMAQGSEASPLQSSALQSVGVDILDNSI